MCQAGETTSDLVKINLLRDLKFLFFLSQESIQDEMFVI